jgi:hypothetical protein
VLGVERAASGYLVNLRDRRAEHLAWSGATHGDILIACVPEAQLPDPTVRRAFGGRFLPHPHRWGLKTPSAAGQGEPARIEFATGSVRVRANIIGRSRGCVRL